MEIRPGMLARSKAGHDKDCIYVITDVKNEYVYLADGSHRTLARPKKKNRKHLQPIGTVQSVCISDDAAIRKAVRDHTLEGEAAAVSMRQK